MSYMALYRKKRPKNFEDVVGQDHIVTTLMNQIKSERIAHAYLFCGTRGTGKTSTAKIFAKVVNCENPIDGHPCNKCRSCIEIDEGRSMNIIEIDAASNNGVDNIREIREEVKYLPTEGKYKVYIIDEVHMLSIGAFNALLKTLEEPPAHVIFILATTDPQKIPATILSRCQRFDFRRISTNDIAIQLKKYMEEEKVDIEDEALHYIARLSEGSMRDALSILDQSISFHYGKKITLDDILDMIGAVDIDVFFKFTNILNKRDSLKAMALIDDMILRGRDISQFVIDFISHLRNLLVIKSTSKPELILDLSREHIELLKEQSKEIDGNTIFRWIKIFSELSNDLKYADQKRILLEVTVIRICQPIMDDSNHSLIDRIKLIEEKLEKGIRIETKKETVSNSSTSSSAVQVTPKTIAKKPKAVPEDIKKGVKIWNDIKLELDEVIQAFLKDAKAGYLEDDIYYIVFKDGSMIAFVEKYKDIIKQKIEEMIKKEINLKLISANEYTAKYKEIYGGYEEAKEEKEQIEKVIEFFKQKDVNVEVE
ncbi:DNA polymerase III subunit gamma/tau [Defluviitalea phaphyphila]|uniref:DNA polymerase III subunit gamma/tau n=1 Tax=Defluviitalea phaphyphila TaxID=1473580 RepID=UPI000730B112|nr:DNA polymerase III subunit gamma/tau [Defluviitalea phaphyphila]